MNTLNKDKLLELAKEAELVTSDCAPVLDYSTLPDRLERFASLVLSAAQEERDPYLWVRRGARTALHNISFDKPEAGPLDALYLDPPSSDQVWNEAREFVAKWVDQRRHDYESEHGFVDPDTGALEFGRGQHAQLKEEYVAELAEIAEGIRSLKRPLQAQEPAKCSQCGSTSAISCNGMGCGYLESGNGEPESSASGAVDSQPSPDELPPLPAQPAKIWLNDCCEFERFYSADQMREYARLSRAQAAQQAQAVSDAVTPWQQRRRNGTARDDQRAMEDEIRELRALLSQSAAPVSEQPAAHVAKAWLVDGRMEQGLFFDKDAADAMAEANCGTVRSLVLGDLPAAQTAGVQWKPGEREAAIWEHYVGPMERDCPERQQCAGKPGCYCKTKDAAPQPVAGQVGEYEIAGWLQYVDGVKTQNFARDNAELSNVKNIAEIMGYTHRTTYEAVYRAAHPQAAQAKKEGDA